jgi:mannose-6-phosphate isomerase-like protein (cupin superfamily)
MNEATALKPILLQPDEGRAYPFGGDGRFVIKADGEEVAGRYAVMEVWIEPGLAPLGAEDEANAHEQDHVMYVISGALSAFVDGRWSDMPKGSFLFIPGGTNHSFRNQGSVPAGYLSFNTPGGIEARMPEITAGLAALREKAAAR